MSNQIHVEPSGEQTGSAAIAGPDLGPTVADARAAALALIPSDAPDGPALGERLAALVALGCAASATTLDNAGVRAAAERALMAGATGDEVHEVVLLVSALGVHALHEGSRVVADVLRAHGDSRLTGAREPRAEELLAPLRADRYWQRLEDELPGFLDALVRLSPEMFVAFRDFCAVPWRTGVLPAKEKEIVYLSVDAMPTHRYLPGLRLHVVNALGRGASRQEIAGALDIAAVAGPSRGIPPAPGR